MSSDLLHNSFIQKNHKPLFYIVWVFIGLLHAGNSGLFDDEAYYWMYSRFPAWGYFDHPPMIGYLIGKGMSFFRNELGLRFFTVLLSTATLWGIDGLLEKRNDRLFYAIALSMGLLQIGGIIAVPDIPLMFFVVLFFHAYRRFAEKQGLTETMLLGLTIAGMLYSKYHGVLVVFFTFMSNIRLLGKIQTWISGLVALMLFMPHLYWQYAHGYPSVRYHLYERNAAYYKPEYTIEYLIGQVLLAGPLIGWLLLWSAAKMKDRSKTGKALKWTMYGIYGFFLLSTFKGRVEANWTAPAFISLFVLSHQYMIENTKAAQWVYRLFLPSFILVLAVRLYMMLDIDPLPVVPKDEFHKNREWSVSVREKAAGSPVVFINTYQRPSQYFFYSGDTSFGLNNIFYRRNNYNFWPLESRLMGRKVLLATTEKNPFFTDSIRTSRGNMAAQKVENYFSFSQVDISTPSLLSAENGKLKAILDINIPEAFLTHEYYERFDTAQLVISVFKQDKKKAVLIQSGAELRSVRNGKISVDVNIPPGLIPGIYKAKWGINTIIPGWPSLNSSGFALEIR